MDDARGDGEARVLTAQVGQSVDPLPPTVSSVSRRNHAWLYDSAAMPKLRRGMPGWSLGVPCGPARSRDREVAPAELPEDRPAAVALIVRAHTVLPFHPSVERHSSW